MIISKLNKGGHILQISKLLLKMKKNWRDATISMVTKSDFVRINKDNILQQRNSNKTMLSKT